MKRNFIYLAVVTVIALALVFIATPTDQSAEKSVVDELLLPGAIASQINEVERVEIITAGDTTVATLVRKDAAWQVEQMHGYRADWPKLQALLAALAQARVVEAKTDKPEYYARLGVEDVSAENAGSVLVRLTAGEQNAAILIGNVAAGRQGQYVRLQDSAGSVLVDREIEVPKQTLDWADAKIIDINSAEVAKVEITHPTSEQVRVMRISADQTDFDLAGLPQDREIRSSWVVNSLGSVFTLLNMQSVRPASGVDWTNAVVLRLLTFSGVEVRAELVTAGDEYLLRLHASQPAASVVQLADTPPVAGQQAGDQTAGEQASVPAGDAAQQPDPEAEKQAALAIQKQVAEEVRKQVEDINRRVEGWAYGIPQQKYENMVKKLEDLLKPPASS